MAYSYTGRRLIADILEDITGLTEWVDYFPVQYDETTDTATKEGALIITDEGGTGDNHPVFLVTGRTHPFRCSATGYVPIVDPVAPPAPSLPSILDYVVTYDDIANVSTSNHTVLIPAVSAGDLLVMVANNGQSRTNSRPDGTWNKYIQNKVWSQTATGTAGRTSYFWKIATADAAASTVTLPAGGACYLNAVVFRIEKDTFDSETPLYIDPTVTDTAGALAASITPITCTPEWGSDDYLWIPMCIFAADQTATHARVDEVADEITGVSTDVGSTISGFTWYYDETAGASLSPYDFDAYAGLSPAPTTARMQADTLAIRPTQPAKTGFPELLDSAGTYVGVTVPLQVSHDYVIPAHEDGDLLVIFCHTSSSGTTIVPSTPSGWTLLGTPTITTSNANNKMSAFYKIATADSAATTVTVSLSNSASHRAQAVCLRIAKNTFDPTTPIEVGTPNGTSASGAAYFDPNTMTPSWGSAKTLWIPFDIFMFQSSNRFMDIGKDSAEVTAYTPTAASTNFAGAFYTKKLETASFTPYTWQGTTSSTWGETTIIHECNTFAIKPAP